MSDEASDAVTRIVEVKRQLDGTEQRFDCELVQRTDEQLLILYRMERPRERRDSYGCFWVGRPYVCYYIVDPDSGAEWRTRFDIARAVEWDDHEVRYTDLLLDLWIEDGEPRWEDEDELRAAVASAQLDPADVAFIERARDALAREHAAIRRDIRAVLGELGRL